MSLKGLSSQDREPRILKTWPNSKGYLEVCLSHNGIAKNVRVDRLIALAFYGACSPGHEVYPNDGNKTNNCAGNLRYDTPENNPDQVRHGTRYEASRDRCDQGHEFTPENTMKRKGRNGNTVRKCKKCHAITTARYRARKRTRMDSDT